MNQPTKSNGWWLDQRQSMGRSRRHRTTGGMPPLSTADNDTGRWDYSFGTPNVNGSEA